MEYTQMKFDANAMEQAISKFRALLPNNVEDLRNFGEDKMKLAPATTGDVYEDSKPPTSHKPYAWPRKS